MDGQKWPFLAVNRPSQAHRASTSGKNTESLVFPWKNWQFLAIMTWLLASKMMRCIAKSAFKWIPVVIFHFTSRSGLLLKCFVSYTQMHKVGILPFITRSNRQNYAMCVVSPCSYTFQVLLETDFYSICINRRFPLGKRTIRTWPSRIYPHLEGFKLASWDTPVAHQIVAGNSISGT